MGLERRRDVAFAFFNILELNKDGKITSEQEEFLGPLMIQIVQKNDSSYYDMIDIIMFIT